MGAYIARQPNGLLCRFSQIVDCPTDDNMTEEDYIELCAERAREEAREALKNPNFIKDFNNVREDFRNANMTVDEFKAWLKSVGDTEEFEYNSIDYECDNVIDMTDCTIETKAVTLPPELDIVMKCFEDGNFGVEDKECRQCSYYNVCRLRYNSASIGDFTLSVEDGDFTLSVEEIDAYTKCYETGEYEDQCCSMCPHRDDCSGSEGDD